MNTDVMGPALAVLAGGVVVGLVMAARGRQAADAAIALEADRNDLMTTHAEALSALKQLELDKDKLDPNEYAAERAALLSRGAAALRVMQGAAPVVTASLASLPDLPMPPGSNDTLTALRDLLDEHGSERFRAAMVALAKERPKAVVPQLLDGAAPVASAPSAVASAPAPVVAAAAPQESVMAPQYQGALAVIMIGALLAALYWVAQGDTVDRRDGASMTGNQDLGAPDAPPTAPGAPQMPPQMAAELKAIQDRLAANPQDLEALNELTEIYVSIGDPGQAMEANNKAFAIAPDDPTTLTFKAILRAMVGMFPPAIEMLRDVVTKHPDHAMAWVYLGLIEIDKGDRAAGIEALRKGVALQPDNFGLKQALERAEAGLPLQGGDPPPQAPAAPAGAPGELIVSGTVKLKDGVSVSGSEVVFVSLKDPSGGPPVAAKKYQANQLPMEFTITTADQISMGGPPKPLPASLVLSVRVDADNDGSAFTKTPLDPQATVEGISKGQTGLALELAAP